MLDCCYALACTGSHFVFDIPYFNVTHIRHTPYCGLGVVTSQPADLLNTDVIIFVSHDLSARNMYHWHSWRQHSQPIPDVVPMMVNAGAPSAK